MQIGINKVETIKFVATTDQYGLTAEGHSEAEAKQNLLNDLLEKKKFLDSYLKYICQCIDSAVVPVSVFNK